MSDDPTFGPQIHVPDSDLGDYPEDERHYDGSGRVIDLDHVMIHGREGCDLPFPVRTTPRASPPGSTPAASPPGSTTDFPGTRDTSVRGDDTTVPPRRPDMSDLLDRIQDIRSTVRPRPSFTLETGRGETYRHARPVLYAHSTYDREFGAGRAAQAAVGGAVGLVGRGP